MWLIPVGATDDTSVAKAEAPRTATERVVVEMYVLGLWLGFG